MRQQGLKRTCHPGPVRKLKRKLQNFFKTIGDAMAEIINLLISRAKKTAMVGGALNSRDKYVSQIKNELIRSVDTSYEPLLEKHLGHKIVLEVITDNKVIEHAGVLKDYTSDFIEIMDVNDKCQDDPDNRTADLLIPRKYGIVRHLAE